MATNRDLKTMVRNGEFREDLYYRVCVFQLALPSLRENMQALHQSIYEIFNQLKVNYQKPYSILSDEALSFLLLEKWKGNFRELKNSLEYALVMSEERRISVNDFPKRTLHVMKPTSFLEDFPCDFGQSLEIFEKMYLQAVLEENCGKVNETARKLGMSKTTLIQKARKYEINTLKMRADASLLVA